MTYLIIFLILFILFGYIGYPISVVILSKVFKYSREKKEIYPTVGFLIAAYNEVDNIEEKIINTLSIDYPKNLLEIIVVSDGSDDGTDAIVKKYEDRGVKLYRVEGRVGKTEARNQAVLSNRNEIIVFSDATAEYEADAVKKLVRNFSDPKIGMVSGNLIYKDDANSNIGMATKLYWKYESLIKKSQGKMKTLTGAIGCINAFRRECYTVLPENIIEDFTEPLTIILNGYDIAFEEEAIAYERTTQKSSQEFHMRVRVIRGGMTGLLYAKKVLNPFKFPLASIQLIGHKVLRWLMPSFLILLVLSTTIEYFTNPGLLISLLFISQVVFYTLGIIGLLVSINGPFRILLTLPSYFLVINSAALKALYLTLTTKLEATWETNVY
ncbi:glycosyltransferase family 2 protein [Halobacteriovorax sp.]|uniref:glycosyltransferase family 2 protein n=1 Tax=Halobacteriovorax sp. TaxID=2020862 RepID=UPI003564027B